MGVVFTRLGNQGLNPRDLRPSALRFHHVVAAAVAADQDPADYHPPPTVVVPPQQSALPHAPFTPHFSPVSYESYQHWSPGS